MAAQSLFKWRHFLEEMIAERGVEVDHSTIHRWVLSYTPELDKRVRPHLSETNDSWRVEETYIQVKGVVLKKMGID